MAWRRRVRQWWRDYRWYVVGVAAVVAVILGYWGFGHVEGGSAEPVVNRFYQSLQLYPLESGNPAGSDPWQIQIARLLAPAVAAYLALSAVGAIFRDQLAHARTRLFARNHVVVCGLGLCGRRLAPALRAHQRVVAIEPDPEHPAVRESRDAGVVVFIGDATDQRLLRFARVDRARHLIAVSGDDGTNLTIAGAARVVAATRRGVLTAHVHLEDAELRRLLVESELDRRRERKVRHEFFNVGEIGAPVLLAEHPAFDADGRAHGDDPHVLIVGLGQMGSRLLVEIARTWRQQQSTGGERLRVTVVERAAGQHADSLRVRYPRLDDACELLAFDHEVTEPEFERGEFLLKADGQSVTVAYLCLGDDTTGLGAAVALRRHVAPDVPIVVRTTDVGGPTGLLGTEGGPEGGIHTFPLFDRICRPEVLLRGVNETLARAIHEDYQQKQRAEGKTPAENPSMVDWDELPETLRDSNRDQADDIGAKLEAVGAAVVPLVDWDEPPLWFSPAEVEKLGIMEHDRWWREREAAGWTYAKEKNTDRKQSPYLVPWAQLTEEIKQYDRNTVEAMPEFLAGAGFAVVRVAAPGDRDA